MGAISKVGLTGSEIKLLNNFVAKDDSNFVMQYIYISRDTVSACDGKKAVRIYKDAGLPDLVTGVYKIINKELISKAGDMFSVTVEAVDGQYPEIDKVLHNNQPEAGKIIIADDKKDSTVLTRAVLEVKELTGRAVQYSFLKALAVSKYEEEFTLYGEPGTAEKPVFLKSFVAGKMYIEAVMLPFKMERR